MKTYNNYKDCGIQWIGEIPESWEIKKLGYISEMIVPMRDKPKELDGPIPWLRIEDFEGKYVGNSKSNQGVTEDVVKEMNLKVLPIGTVLCSCSCAMGIAAIVTKPLITNQTFIGIVPSRKLDSSFLYYTLQTAKQYLDNISTGAIQTYLSRETFEKLGICIPKIEEQTAIANYLDSKTTEMDRVVADKEALVDLYEEEKKALINETVTKGVTLSGVETIKTKLKPSGIDWLGDVPEHWEVKKLKYVADIQGRIGFKGYSKSDLVDEGALTIGAKHIDKRNLLDLTDPEYISWDKYYESPEIMVKKGDILVTQRGSLGKVAIIDEEIGEATINPSMLIVKNLLINDQFLFNFFSSNIFIDWIKLVAGGTAVPMISQDQLYNFSLLLPPLQEQTAIVQYIESETANINEKINRVKQEIDLLKEYRQALIFEAVTGKVKVD